MPRPGRIPGREHLHRGPGPGAGAEGQHRQALPGLPLRLRPVPALVRRDGHAHSPGSSPPRDPPPGHHRAGRGPAAPAPHRAPVQGDHRERPGPDRNPGRPGEALLRQPFLCQGARLWPAGLGGGGIPGEGPRGGPDPGVGSARRGLPDGTQRPLRVPLRASRRHVALFRGARRGGGERPRGAGQRAPDRPKRHGPQGGPGRARPDGDPAPPCPEDGGHRAAGRGHRPRDQHPRAVHQRQPEVPG